MIKIQKATVNDAELIAEIGGKSFLESHGHSASENDIKNFIDKTYHEKAIAEEFKNGNVQYYIISFEDKIAGFSKIEINALSPWVDEVAVTKLDRFYLLEAFHGKKLGVALFNFIIETSKQYNQKGIWLAVWVENLKAINFYTKNGFKIVGDYDFKLSDTRSNPNHIMFKAY
ncbi:GNAT family N-acetyltransferase [Algibacter sp. L4_22]|uniref:GNAT family N-acetyltransferase n=1 Tax=Algibacter sp. L4_22 TaxID=2942477 RepID=UPI00201B4850|nr:GNAT family N-acetyltransferase [Algibacter sp. L4_22]MCL5129566.1 GNAT family N-acetyltransferase [Algibacter sp. L4_22]